MQASPKLRKGDGEVPLLDPFARRRSGRRGWHRHGLHRHGEAVVRGRMRNLEHRVRRTPIFELRELRVCSVSWEEFMKPQELQRAPQVGRAEGSKRKESLPVSTVLMTSRKFTHDFFAEG